MELLEYKIALKLSFITESLWIRLHKFTYIEKCHSYFAYSYSVIRSIERDLKEANSWRF